MLSLNTPIENIGGVGKTVAVKLKRLGVFTAGDLIYWYPFRYDDFSNLKKIDDLEVGEVATVKGKIELLENRRSYKKKMIITECFLTDESGSIKAIWFGQPFITKLLQNNDEVYFSGKVEGDLFDSYFKNPSYEKVSNDTAHTARIVPIYPLTVGLTQKQLRFLIKQALPLVKQIADWLPEKVIKNHQLINLTDALANIHFPGNKQKMEQAVRKLKFNELLQLHLQNYLISKDLKESISTPLEFHEKKTKEIVKNLGFTLTDAQRKCAWQILLDMEKPRPMNRLLEGDVGSGKTAVAALAVANCILNKSQAVVLAPTEILASQHFQSFRELLKPVECCLALLTSGKQMIINTTDEEPEKISKAKLLKLIAAGEIDLVIGTHALIQEKVEFKNLGLVIIDEQHRFGVDQRKAIREKSGDAATTPHLLSMTATPIPRTLALTIYGNLDLSIIDELPPGRKKPETKLVEPQQRKQAYDFIKNQIKQGRQGLVICPLIEESDKLGVKAATEEYQKLSAEVFSDLKIGLLHGKLKPKVKEEVMNKFHQGKLDLLVTTSVVEVGVNVPNANVMIIESAERFGLAQLHQFRGRVNRSSRQSYCFLFTESSAEKSIRRLKTLVGCFDGFKLAEEDLKIRGSGNLIGSKQTGFFTTLKIAKLTDVELIEETKKASQIIVEEFPEILETIKLAGDVHPE
ncbi:ATP-dependent DNA helicase RecG [Patescibacteria group bacterium]|nr:ATP-dependent DNA helicase RecG [Patescibacteria group bacterium]